MCATRASSNPTELTSIATQSTPSLSMSASSACSCGASGVVILAWTCRPLMTCPLVPICPSFTPANRQILATAAADVVFPFVPVIPIIFKWSLGRPWIVEAKYQDPDGAHRAANRYIERDLGSRCQRDGRRPRSSALGMKWRPSVLRPDRATKSPRVRPDCRASHVRWESSSPQKILAFQDLEPGWTSFFHVRFRSPGSPIATVTVVSDATNAPA